MGQTADTSASKINITSDTYIDAGNKGTNYDGDVLSIEEDGGGTEERVALLSFPIADPGTLGIPTNSILRGVTINVSRTTSGPSACIGQMCFLNSSFTENQANWYGPDDASNTAVMWEPAFDGASESSVKPGPLKGLPIESFNVPNAATLALDITKDMIVTQGLDFGSVVNVGMWALGGGPISFEDDSNSDSSGDVPKYYITYEIPTPSSPSISIKPNSDGVTGTITIDEDTDSEDLQLYSICWHSTDTTPDHGDNVTDFTDTGKTTFDTSTLTGSALGTEDTSYYFRLYAEDSVNTNDNGGASNVIHVRRPKVTLSTSSVISPSSLAIGEETSLTVVADAVTEAEYGGKFSSVLVNWDSGASDTDADYSEYFFDQATAPALTTAGNLTITHRYDSDGSKAIKVRVRDPNGWLSDKATLATGATVAEADPIARIASSKGKVLSSKFADLNNMLTISGAQSRAIGSDREIQNYLFTCSTGETSTFVTMGAFDNNNEVFDTCSKRVALRQLDDDNMNTSGAGMRLKLYGLASFTAGGTAIKDSHNSFAYYKYVSELLMPIDGTGATVVFKEGSSGGDGNDPGHFTYNYFKSVEAAVVTDNDASDSDGSRYVLTAYAGDFDESATATDITSHSSGVLLAEDLDNSEQMIDVDDVEPFRVGDVIKINNECMKVLNRDSGPNRLYVIRGYLFSTKATHDDDDVVKILDPYIVNKEIRYASDITTGNYHSRYRWGGFAWMLGEGGTAIDFLVHDGSAAGAGNTIVLQDIAAGSSSQDDLCWFNNGFFEDDIIMVGNTSDNGSYATPKFFKLAGFESSGSGNFDLAYVYGSDVDSYITAGVATDANEDADIVRIVNNPNRTVAIYHATLDDEVTFELRTIDNDASSFLGNHDGDFVTVNMAQPNILGLITATDYDTLTAENTLTSSDIAILNVDKRRLGGVTASMPLGNRKYPIGVIRTKMGLPTIDIRLRILSSTGLRKIRSLIEGDTYDYVFIDNSQIDSPGTVDVTYRLKFKDGMLNRTPELGSEYIAQLNFVIVGEDVT